MMVKLTRIYTRGGDTGKTSLTGGTRVSKDDCRVRAYGDVDETNAAIGIARLYVKKKADAMLMRIQHDLFDLGADLSTPHSQKASKTPLRMVAAQVTRLEKEIDAMNAGLKPLNSFVLPGGSKAAGYLHLARTVCRRAERSMVGFAARHKVNPVALQYINRLSDHLFVLARHVNAEEKGDALWQPGKNR